ncbi:hypothetical protein BKA62DRAFT_644311, partial [Auriculariales sp. MPI-PUGE-AT-0066]
MADMDNVDLRKTAQLLSLFATEMTRLGWSQPTVRPPEIDVEVIPVDAYKPQGRPTESQSFLGVETLKTRQSPNSREAVELPWEDTFDKRYPLPEQSKFTEYEKRYPPDKYGSELDPNARVFKMYRDRVTEKDENLVHGWHDTLNVLLVFAGLFSAVLTAFLVESSKLLSPDYNEAAASATIALLAHFKGTSGNSVIPAAPSAPSRDARWINRLWFLSLSLSLAVSLLSILVKQWLVQYSSLMRSSADDARRWAWRHYALRRGLSRWGVEPLISWLCVLLHVSLFLFLAGLVRFIDGLDPVISNIIITVSALTGIFYVASTVAPLLWADCPSRTS